MKKKVIFQNALTLDLAIACLGYIAQEKIEKPKKPTFTTKAQF